MSAQVSEPAKAQAGESERRLRLPVFRAAQRHWTVGGVLAIAPLVLRERKSESPAVGIAQAADDAAVDAAVQAFRYARGLVSAQDCLAWLAARALSFADLRASLRRRLGAAPAPNEALAHIDLMLADDFRLLARAVASRIAVAAGGCPNFPEAGRRPCSRSGRAWSAGSSPRASASCCWDSPD